MRKGGAGSLEGLCKHSAAGSGSDDESGDTLPEEDRQVATSRITERLMTGTPDPRGEIRKLTTLLEISQTLSGTLDLKATLHRVLEILERHHGILRSAVTVLDAKSRELHIEASNGRQRVVPRTFVNAAIGRTRGPFVSGQFRSSLPARSTGTYPSRRRRIKAHERKRDANLFRDMEIGCAAWGGSRPPHSRLVHKLPCCRGSSDRLSPQRRWPGR